MQKSTKFPLLSGSLSIDLVNTEVVRNGQRHNLLVNEADIVEWLNTMQQYISIWNDEIQDTIHQSQSEIMQELLQIRGVLREQFEHIADHKEITSELLQYLEQRMEAVSFTFKLIDGELTAIPRGEIWVQIAALIVLDALKLVADGKLIHLKRCSNKQCVLLFVDEGGRRKWCSMKICGNRHKVASFHQRKVEE